MLWEAKPGQVGGLDIFFYLIFFLFSFVFAFCLHFEWVLHNICFLGVFFSPLISQIFFFFLWAYAVFLSLSLSHSLPENVNQLTLAAKVSNL